MLAPSFFDARINMNKNNVARNTPFLKSRLIEGQTIILVMGIVLVASVVVFMVFNSGRAVNEKINLVNAADAAAYSGAQVAARQLNFMAYTNRAMITNEVAIGHMFSFQKEAELVVKSVPTIIEKAAIPGWLAFLFPGLADLINLVVNSIVSPLLQPLVDIANVMSGVYATTIDANNAYYSALQYAAFQDFAVPSNGRTVVESAMMAVLDEYEVRPSAPIILNREETLSSFENSSDAGIASAVSDARSMGSDFCGMIMFLAPGAGAGDSIEPDSSSDAFCAELLSGDESGDAGPPTSTDNGVMLNMLRTTVSSLGNAQWIRDRSTGSYNLPVINVTLQRSGSTDVEFRDGQLNWRSQGDILDVEGTQISVQGDAATMSMEAAAAIDGAVLQTLNLMGLCGNGPATIDCASVASGRYGGLRRYAHLNSAHSPVVTAFLSQSNCSDSVGVDENGIRRDGWNDKLRFMNESLPLCTDTVYAVSKAQVYFERPPCSGAGCDVGFSPVDSAGGRELPNLFNPFWQVRIVPL